MTARALLLPALAALAVVVAAPGRALLDDAGRDLELARGYERRIVDLVAAVRSTVVTIELEATTEDGTPVRSGGSGVHLGGGLVLTNDHVTEGRDSVNVGLADGRTVTGSVKGRDATGDIALLELPVKDLPAAARGDSQALVVGQPVVALGNPFGLAQADHQPAAVLGIVSGLHRYQGGEKVYGDALQVDAPVNPGNSGGPLFDLAGRLVGITGRIAVRGGVRHNVGVGFCVPLHQVLLVLGRLERGEAVDRAWLGVRFLPVTDGTPGVVVRDVLPGSPAAAAGVHAGDRVVALDGRPIDQPMRLQNALAVLPAGTKVELRVVREGAELTLEVTLTARRSP